MNTSPYTPFVSFVGRLLWLLIGPLALIPTLIGIVQTGQGWLTGFDIAFFVIVAVMLLGRVLEFGGGEPQTADGTPATPTHLHRYLIGLPLFALALWVVANLIANR